jgi:hypothetical protein
MKGNGRGTRYYEGIMSLPDEAHEKIEENWGEIKWLQ